MIIKTKKYQLDKKTYIKLALVNVLKQQWWAFLIPLALIIAGLFLPGTGWYISGAILLTVLYLLFWLIQFTGVTQLEQSKIIFDRLSYEIDSRQVMIKLNPRQGSPIQWNMIKRAEKGKDYFLLIISKGQLIYLPYKVFNSENDIRFMESILKRKNYIK
ncbi:YcxB family protein [Cytophagaceae bacterium ABcell3]|nr:YcxB family protein [Cytophagaceae bacterium ABcell3]